MSAPDDGLIEWAALARTRLGFSQATIAAAVSVLTGQSVSHAEISIWERQLERTPETPRGRAYRSVVRGLLRAWRNQEAAAELAALQTRRRAQARGDHRVGWVWVGAPEDTRRLGAGRRGRDGVVLRDGVHQPAVQGRPVDPPRDRMASGAHD